MWNYVQNNLGINEGYFNVVHYGAYDGVSKKPTIFYSNLDLELRKVGKGYKSKLGQAQQARKDRSDIPKKLLIEVFEKFEKL